MHKLLRSKRLLVGVVHLPATPGSPRFQGNRGAILRRASDDATALIDGGADALIVENFGDVPFFAERVPPEAIATMALALQRVIEAAGGAPVGVNVLRNDARAALGLCAATGASFVRINVHAGAAVTDQGVIEGKAAETLRERARLCPGVALLCDVHVKHAVPLGGGSIESAAADTLQRGLADALVVSGSGTGHAPDVERVAAVRRAVGDAPLLIGSGLSENNAAEMFAHASGAIVGTSLKRNGAVDEPVEVARVERLRRLLDGLGAKA
ncbi:MAG: BtpA/SgcQ family protein [Planctomycetes bacterium]|nr:BtpA/SgcQ family protein [Planctomycetota bacterium]